MFRALYRNLNYYCRCGPHAILNNLNHPIVVLAYHRVTTLDADPQLLAVTPSNFRKQLEIISKYPVHRFEEDWTTMRKPALVITFDDGYADNLLEAVPILEEFDVPATVFVTTGNVENREEFWWDELERLILAPMQVPPVCILVERNGQQHTWPSRTRQERQHLYERVHRLIYRCGTPNDAFCLIEQLRSWAGLSAKGRETHRPLTLSELVTLAQHPLVTIGSHGMNHLPFSSVAPIEQKAEIISSRLQLQQWLGRDVKIFSYPFGSKRDFSNATMRFVRDAGFQKAAANFPGQWHSWTDSYRIPRHLVRNWDGDIFSSWLRRFWLL